MKTPTGKAASNVAKRVGHSDPVVDTVFDAYPKPVKARLLARGADASLKDKAGKRAADLTVLSSLREKLTPH